MANVFTSVANVAWATDKCRISTGDSAVTYQVRLNFPPAGGNVGNLFSEATAIPANWLQDVFVGVGNQLTITGNNFTAQEVGTASSGSAGVL